MTCVVTRRYGQPTGEFYFELNCKIGEAQHRLSLQPSNRKDFPPFSLGRRNAHVFTCIVFTKNGLRVH